MKPTDMPAFAKLWTRLGLRYGKALSEYLIESYWQELQAYDFSEIKEAVRAHLLNPDRGQFFPQSADIVRYILGDTETQALRAWSKVNKAIRHIGSYQSVVFDDARIHAVIDDMGGWIYFCRADEHQLPFQAKEFQKRYAGYVLHPPLVYPRLLTGRTAWQNSQYGHPEPDPILIGNSEKAQLVSQQGESLFLSKQQTLPLLQHSTAQNISADFITQPKPEKQTIQAKESSS